MPELLMFTVPGVPKGKARPRVTRTGHAFTPKGTVEYENMVRMSFVTAYPDRVPIPANVPVSAGIKAYFPIPKSWSKKKREAAELDAPTKKPDLDNIAKSILDSLNTIAFCDDSQVVYLMVSKHYSDRPRVEVRLAYETGE